MLEHLLGGQDFNFLPHLATLVVAYLLALPIGWNREKEERSAGLRTFPLVAVATCGFIQAAQAAGLTTPEAMARIVEGVIAGINRGHRLVIRRTRVPERHANTRSRQRAHQLQAAIELRSKRDDADIGAIRADGGKEIVGSVGLGSVAMGVRSRDRCRP